MSKTKTTKSWIWICILLISLFMIIVGTFEIFQFENLKLHGRIAALGFLLQASYFIREYFINVKSKKEKKIPIKKPLQVVRPEVAYETK